MSETNSSKHGTCHLLSIIYMCVYKCLTLSCKEISCRVSSGLWISTFCLQVSLWGIRLYPQWTQCTLLWNLNLIQVGIFLYSTLHDKKIFCSIRVILLSNLVNEEEMMGKFCLSQLFSSLQCLQSFLTKKCLQSLIDLSIWSLTYFYFFHLVPKFQMGQCGPSIREQIDSLHNLFLIPNKIHWNRKAKLGMYTRIKPSFHKTWRDQLVV